MNVNPLTPKKMTLSLAVSRFVVVLCIGVFIWQQLVPFKGQTVLLFASTWSETLLMPYRLITPAFMHWSWWHILFNLLAFWFFALQIELRNGAGFMAVFVALTAVVSNVAQFAVSGPYFGGLSGVVFALAGFLWAANRRSVNLGGRVLYNFPGVVLAQVLLLLALGIFGVFEFVGVNMGNAAHWSGFMSGVLAGILLPTKMQKPDCSMLDLKSLFVAQSRSTPDD